jgi:hypothetical protein
MRSVGYLAHFSLSSLLCLAACSAGGVTSPGGGGTMDSGMTVTQPPPVDTGTTTMPPPDSGPPSETPADASAPGTDTTIAVDAGPTTTGDGGGNTTIPVGLRYKDFTCSWVLGIHTVAEWYAAGFEMIVDDARWQISGLEMAQFEWKNAGFGGWNAAPGSPCAMNSKTPDRIAFYGVDSGSTTAAEFVPQYEAVIANIKTKFPSVKRIDLMTMTRAPGNMECKGANRSGSSWIRPGQDEAIAMMAQKYPGFVFVGTKLEVLACSDFGLCPHINAAANARVAMLNAQWFMNN